MVLAVLMVTRSIRAQEEDDSPTNIDVIAADPILNELVEHHDLLQVKHVFLLELIKEL